MSPVTVAAVQAAPEFLDRDATIGKVAALAAAAASGAQLIVSPEVFVPGTPDWVLSGPVGHGDGSTAGDPASRDRAVRPDARTGRGWATPSSSRPAGPCSPARSASARKQ